MEYTIYVITNEVNGKEYVGVTSDLGRRWREHKGRAHRDDNRHLYNAMRKYGPDEFSIQPVEHTTTQNRALSLEKQWIADLDTYHGRGYNMTEGGDEPPALTGEDHPMYGRTGEDHPSYGEKHSDKTKRKLSEANSGEDHPFYGMNGEDHPSYGHKHSDKTKRKLSEANSGANNPFYGINGEDHPMGGITGKAHPQSKLSDSKASVLKWYAVNSSLTQRSIGQIFGISRSHVSDIKNGKERPNLDPKPPADNGQLRLPLGAT